MSLYVKPHRKDTFDKTRPPNETPELKARWETATAPGTTIPAGVLTIEKWSNGHYSEPEQTLHEALPTDNTGSPLRTCERRILPTKETPDAR